jgi:chemotaxis protein histidine kinase CheA
MAILNDPSMKEIVNEFCSESLVLVDELNAILEIFEEDPSAPAILEDFGQIIDRIMGAAKSIGAQDIATFCELGKIIGYKSGQTTDVALLNVVSAVLFDATDLLKKMIEALSSGDGHLLKNVNTTAFASRLRWLSEKFKNIERSTCNYSSKANKEQLDQGSIDQLIESLGL